MGRGRTILKRETRMGPGPPWSPEAPPKSVQRTVCVSVCVLTAPLDLCVMLHVVLYGLYKHATDSSKPWWLCCTSAMKLVDLINVKKATWCSQNAFPHASLPRLPLAKGPGLCNPAPGLAPDGNQWFGCDEATSILFYQGDRDSAWHASGCRTPVCAIPIQGSDGGMYRLPFMRTGM